jgi:glycosyltransferase involved in cell wall biosynthesis
VPTVSIIIPCYNQARYLREALQSVAAQEWPDWEAMVVDDGSTDDTRQVAAGFGDSRVRYLYQQNRGLSGARNTGLRMAKGRYVAFLDADDEWEPAFLARCVKGLVEAPEAVGVYASSRFIDETGRVLPQSSQRPMVTKGFRRRILEGGFFPVHAALVRREALQRHGGFDESLTSLEDWDLWLRLSAQGPMIGIAEPLARYRVYAGSMSTDADRMQANRLAVLAKHFGPPAGEAAGWADEKRHAYAFAQRAAALAFLEQGQVARCWEAMAQAAAYWPEILGRLDTYYELSCGAQAKGYRGWPTAPEIRANGAMVMAWLESLFGQEKKKLSAYRAQAFGQAYLALGMLADQAGDWAQGRVYLRRALMADPHLITRLSVLRRLVKLHSGKGLADIVRKWLGALPARRRSFQKDQRLDR